MSKHLTEAARACYRDDGYHTPIEVMSETKAGRLLQKFEQAEVNFPEALGPFGRNNAHLTFMCLDEIAHHKVILGAVEDLLGPDFISGEAFCLSRSLKAMVLSAGTRMPLTWG